MTNLKNIILVAVISTFGSDAYASDLPSYDRKEWKHWVDEDRDCEDTREEALVRDATMVFYSNASCKPVMGVWNDPYTNKRFFFSSRLDADHIVPLKWAHDHGAWQWPKSLKREFANDLDNIIMVSASANRSKGAKGLDEYLPPNEDYHCEYIDKFNHMVDKYHLELTDDEEIFTSVVENECKNIE